MNSYKRQVSELQAKLENVRAELERAKATERFREHQRNRLVRDATIAFQKFLARLAEL